MLMFGSNDYLGLATHPRLKARVQQAVEAVGVGAGGPPLLNGHGPLHRELEARLAAFEGKEDAMIFSSGYSANVGLMSTLPAPDDLVVYDEESHASTLDGLKMGRAETRPFAHNDARALDAILTEVRGDHRDVFVSVEGVYSMSGDICRLDRIGEVCRRHRATLLMDEAHGTGVTGPGGHGTTAMFDAHDDVAVAMGTFSKAFGVSGGFIAADRDVVEYLRNCARSYIFSTSPATSICAAVLAGLDVIEQEPEIHARLMDVCGYLAEGLEARGVRGQRAHRRVPAAVPAGTDLRAMAHDFHRRGPVRQPRRGAGRAGLEADVPRQPDGRPHAGRHRPVCSTASTRSGPPTSSRRATARPSGPTWPRRAAPATGPEAPDLRPRPPHLGTEAGRATWKTAARSGFPRAAPLPRAAPPTRLREDAAREDHENEGSAARHPARGGEAQASPLGPVNRTCCWPTSPMSPCWAS